MQETAEDHEKLQRKERKAMMAREQEKAKILSRNLIATGNCGNCGKYGHRTDTCWRTRSPKPPTEKGHGSARTMGN